MRGRVLTQLRHPLVPFMLGAILFWAAVLLLGMHFGALGAVRARVEAELALRLAARQSEWLMELQRMLTACDAELSDMRAVCP